MDSDFALRDWEANVKALFRQGQVLIFNWQGCIWLLAAVSHLTSMHLAGCRPIWHLMTSTLELKASRRPWNWNQMMVSSVR